MTDPALDGPDAERAIAKALAACGLTPLDVLVDAAIHALNEQGVVLCDEHALAELRQQAKAHTSGNTPNAPAWVQAVLPSEILRQRSLGWPDFHPEDFCHICGRRNPVWSAPAAVWSLVHGDSHTGIYCPPCFVDIYESVIGRSVNWAVDRCPSTPDAEDPR